MSNGRDTSGREFVRLADLKDRQTVWLDGGFSCACPKAVVVEGSGENAFFRCDDGKHFFDGCAEFSDDDHCVGIYASDPGPLEWQAKP